MSITKYRAFVHPDHVRSQFHKHYCSWCFREMELTGKTEGDMLEVACPHAAKHVEDQERWAKMSEGGQAE